MAQITDGSATFEVKRVLDGTASKAEAAILLGGQGFTQFSDKTIGELKAFILQQVDNAPIVNKEGLFISFTIAGRLYDIVNYITNDDSHVIRAGGQISFIITATSPYSNKYLHIKISSYSYQSYEFGVINGVFEQPRPIVYTLDNGNNTNKITVDRLEGTADKSISADKSYRLSPLIQYVTTTNEKIDNTGMQLKLIQKNIITDGTYPGVNGYILQFAISQGSNYQVQLLIPDNRDSRLKIRCQHGYGDWSGSVWQEIPLAHEVVTLNGNNIVTGTLQAKTQATSDSSDNVATTQFVKNAIAAALTEKGL